MNKNDLKEKIASLEKENPKECLRLHGKLISLLKKDIKKEKNISKKNEIRFELYEELKKHKLLIKNINECNVSKSYVLPKRVGLKVKEIATSLSIFMEKKDLLGKLKNFMSDVKKSTINISSITIVLALLSGTLSISTLAGLVPTIAYVGLSCLIKSGISNTDYSKRIYAVDNKNQIESAIKKFINDYLVNNKVYSELINMKKTVKNDDEKIELNEGLIQEYYKIIKAAPTDDIRKMFKAELLNSLNELKVLYSNKKDDYIKDKNKMTLIEFAKLEKKSLMLDIMIFKEENYLEESTKVMINNIKINTITMYVARMILGKFFPILSFNNISDYVTPFIFTIVNNLANLENIKESFNLKATKYANKKMRLSNEQLFRKIANSRQISFA